MRCPSLACCFSTVCRSRSGRAARSVRSLLDGEAAPMRLLACLSAPPKGSHHSPSLRRELPPRR